MRGFSLIEVMISLVLLSFLMMGTYTMVDNSQRTKDSVITEDRSVLQIQMALNRLEADFSQIYSPAYFSQEKEKKPPDGRYQATEQFPRVTVEGHIVPLLEFGDDTLTFLTSSNRRKMQDVKQSRWAWVRYTLEDSDSSVAWVRRSIAGDPFSPQIYWDKIRPQILVRNVKSIKFWFWDVQGKEWAEQTPDNEEKVHAIKVELVWLDNDEVEQSNTRVFRVLWPHPNFFFNLLQGLE